MLCLNAENATESTSMGQKKCWSEEADPQLQVS